MPSLSLAVSRLRVDAADTKNGAGQDTENAELAVNNRSGGRSAYRAGFLVSVQSRQPVITIIRIAKPCRGD